MKNFSEEKKLEAEIKKMAKQGNKEACGVLAKQLVNLRKQKTRSYAAGAKMNSIQGFENLKVKNIAFSLSLKKSFFILAQTKIMHTNTKMAQSMGKTTKTMQAINKTMDPQKVAKTMQVKFEQQNFIKET